MGIDTNSKFRRGHQAIRHGEGNEEDRKKKKVETPESKHPPNTAFFTKKGKRQVVLEPVDDVKRMKLSFRLLLLPQQ